MKQTTKKNPTELKKTAESTGKENKEKEGKQKRKATK